MRLLLPEPVRDDAVFRRIFDAGMARYPERKANYEKSQGEQRGVQAQAMPTMMDVEPSSRCNYRCPMCLQSVWEGETGDLPLATVQSILDEQPGLWEIKLQGLGEPMLNEDLAAMVQLCSERDIWSRTVVNGSLLHVNDNAQKILEAGIGEIQVSLDGADKEIYEKIRVGGNFELFTQNCTLLNRLAAPLRPTAATRAAVLVQLDNLPQLENIVEYSARVGFQRVTFSLNLGGYGVSALQDANSRRDARREFSLKRAAKLVEQGKALGLEVTFWQGGNKYRTDAPEHLCSWLWNRAFLTAGGRIVPCCSICDPHMMDMGSVLPFSESWNGKAYQSLRAAHLRGTIPDICKACYTAGHEGEVPFSK